MGERLADTYGAEAAGGENPSGGCFQPQPGPGCIASAKAVGRASAEIGIIVTVCSCGDKSQPWLPAAFMQNGIYNASCRSAMGMNPMNSRLVGDPNVPHSHGGGGRFQRASSPGGHRMDYEHHPHPVLCGHRIPKHATIRLTGPN